MNNLARSTVKIFFRIAISTAPHHPDLATTELVPQDFQKQFS